MSIRTIALTLRPTASESTALLRLQGQFNAACNQISTVAWDAQEFNKVRLQRLCYDDVRHDFGLMAQHTIRAIAVVAASYKTERANMHTFRDDAAVVLDTPRLYRIRHNRANVTTLDGRINVELGIGGHQRQMLKDAVKLAEADLIRDRKGRWRLLVSAHYTDPPLMEADGVVGVDLGRTDIAHTSDGVSFSGKQVTAVRDRYARVRRSIQRQASKGTRSTRRRARAIEHRLSGRERRFQRDINHGISKRLMGQAQGNGHGIALEDLTGIRDRTNRQPRGKVDRRRSNSWAFYQLRAFLAYKAVAAGVPLVRVNPAYTSQTCHCCLHIGERAGKRFHCINPSCLWSGDADLNGACTIALVGRLVITPGGPPLCCGLQPGGRATTSPQPLGVGL